MQELAVEQFIGIIRVCVQNLLGDGVVSTQGGEMSELVGVRSTCERPLCVAGKTFRKYVFNELGATWGCYICRVDLKREVELLRKPTNKRVVTGEALSYTYVRLSPFIL